MPSTVYAGGLIFSHGVSPFLNQMVVGFSQLNYLPTVNFHFYSSIFLLPSSFSALLLVRLSHELFQLFP